MISSINIGFLLSAKVCNREDICLGKIPGSHCGQVGKQSLTVNLSVNRQTWNAVNQVDLVTRINVLEISTIQRGLGGYVLGFTRHNESDYGWRS
ncbi:hypothetical protein [Propionibacterium acidifaciens]|uniref:hypothetical protein n=1 Tax=Propionibacterium acidifaciens TaxID=556499 RepID=UPI0028E7D7CE|nr:hypothetical protein [Propionibacterium acidifaciens]